MTKLYISATGNRLYTTRADFIRKAMLPYGQWTCPDGREVLFNRFYEPIWQRRPGQPPAPADPFERVPWCDQEWFYDDSVRDSQKSKRGLAALAGWNVPAPPPRAPLPAV